jgi:hypothetical protein
LTLWAPRSLTVRLALLFALATLLTFTLVGSYLYYSLARQLENHDDQELIGKVTLMRHLAAKARSVQAIRDDPHSFMDAALGHNDLLLIVRSADGALLLNTRPEAGSLPALPMAGVDRTPDEKFRHSLHTSQQRSGPASTAAAKKCKSSLPTISAIAWKCWPAIAIGYLAPHYQARSWQPFWVMCWCGAVCAPPA